MHSWRDHELLRRALDVFGLASLAESEEAPAEVRRARRAAAGGARERRLRGGRPAARGDRRRRLGRAGRRRRFPARPEALTRDQVYGRRPVREALRGRRQVLELWVDRARARGRAVARRRAGQGPGQARARALGCRRDARPPGRASRGPSRTGTPTRGSSRAQERPLLVCLDRVTDPRNLGAVCRSAEGAAATGVVVPAHGSAAVTPSLRKLGRRRRASSGRGGAESRALSRRDQGRSTSGSTPLRATRRRHCGRRTSPTASALVLGAEGKGLRPLVRRTCDARSRSRSPGRSSR